MPDTISPTRTEYDDLTTRERNAARDALTVAPTVVHAYLLNLSAIAWLDRALSVSPRLVDAYGPARAVDVLRRIAASPGDAVTVLTELATAAGSWKRHGAAVRSLVERDRAFDDVLAPSQSTSAAPTGRNPRHAYVIGRGTRRADGSIIPAPYGIADEAHAVDAITILAATRFLYRGDLPSLTGGEHLCYPEVIHAGRSDDPYRVASHHARVSDALATVAPDVREVVAEACADYSVPDRSAHIRWPDRVTHVKRASRTGERVTCARTLTADGTPHTVTVVKLATYRVDRDGTEYVATGHDAWRVRPDVKRATRKRPRRAVTCATASLPVEAERAALTLLPGHSVTLRSDTYRVSVALSKTARFTVRVTNGDGAADVARVRRAAGVRQAIAQRVTV